MAAQSTQQILEKVLKLWAEERVSHMKTILARGKWPKDETNSPLYASIAPDVEVMGDGYKVTIALDEYYIFIDEGVMGLNGQTKTNGRIRFKSMNVSRQMIESITRWGSRKKLQGVTKANMTSRAFATAKKVKKEGIEQTSFFTTPTSDKYINKLADKLQEALGQDFEISWQLQ